MEKADFHKIAVYYTDEIERCPEFGVVLEEYLDLLNIVKDIRAAFDDDLTPKLIAQLKAHIGKELNGVRITKKTWEHARTVRKEYEKAYAVCKKYLHQFSCGEL